MRIYAKPEFKRENYNREYRESHLEQEKVNHRKYYLKNKEEILRKNRVWKLAHPERMRILLKNWNEKNPERRRELRRKWTNEHKDFKKQWETNQRKTNPNFLIKQRIRCLLNQELIRYLTIGQKWSSSKYGIDYPSILQKLIPLPFSIQEKTNWHIDHIIPVSKFDLNNPEEVRKCFSAENLQWLPAKENLAKGDKI